MKASAPRRLPSGSWHIRWTDSSGGRRSATFKSYDAARAALTMMRIKKRLAKPL